MEIDSAWLWLILAVTLAAAELAVPGVFLIWVAAAAALTGLVTLAIEPPVAVQFLTFAAASAGATWAARRWYIGHPVPSSDPQLNDRVARLIGETVVVTVAIVHGQGRARVGDSEWAVRGPDAAVGAVMRVLGVEDGALVVRPVAQLAE